MIRRAALLGLVVALSACGGGTSRVNDSRPPSPVTLTGAIHHDSIQVSPARVGAGQIALLISNQSGRAQKVTMETDEIGGKLAGRRASSPVIPTGATGRLTIDARAGRYVVHVSDRRVRDVHITVGRKRHSSQNDLLLP